MSEYQCENCAQPITKSVKVCQQCGYPQQGSKSEKIGYNTKLMRFKDLVEDSDKSVKGILSFTIIFVFMAFVVGLFSVLFNENHYVNALTFVLCAIFYYLLHRIGKRSSYLMAALAVIFYLGHTLFEFSYGMFMKSPVPLDKSFTETRGATLFFTLIPMAYLLFRLALLIVLGKYFLTEIRLRKDMKMTNFIRSTFSE